MTRHSGRQFTRLHFSILRISRELHFEHRFGHRDQGLSRSRGGHLSISARPITISLKTFAFCGAPPPREACLYPLLRDDKNCPVDALLPEHIRAGSEPGNSLECTHVHARFAEDYRRQQPAQDCPAGVPIRELLSKETPC